MGYRSEVVLAVNKEIMPEFLAHLATNDEAKRSGFLRSLSLRSGL
jgi:hypothetical protein